VSRLSEKRDVQQALVTYLIGSGWDYLPPDETLQARGNNLREPFLLPIARERVVALNPRLVTPANASTGFSTSVEDVIQRLRERQISVRAALEQMTTLTEDAVTASEEQAQSDLHSGEFALYWVIKGQGVAAPKETARQVHAVLDAHPGWAYNPNIESTVRLQLYKVLSDKVQTQTRRGVAGDEPGPMSAQAKRATALKTIVDALLRMNKVVS